MKLKKNTSTIAYNVYDLLNPHLQNVEIITTENMRIKGQFVTFKVVENSKGYQVYPSEKFCFLPIKNKQEFWDLYKKNNGVFNEIPTYIRLFGLNEMKKIIIEPILIS